MIRSERAETLGADLLWKFFMPALKLIHTATTDTTKLSCLCQLRRCELDFRQLKTIADILKSEHIQSNRSVHTVTPDTTQTGPSCRVWCELSRPDKCVQRRSVSGGAGAVGATAGRTPTQNGPTQSTPPDMTHSIVLSRLAGGVNWTLEAISLLLWPV